MSFDAQEAVMNRTSTREEILQKGLVLLLSLVVPAFAWGQHKPSGGGGGSHPSAPAKSAPAHAAPSHSAPSHAAPSHGATQSHTTTPSHGTTSRPSTAGHTTTSRPSTAGHTTTGSRPGTTAGSHAGTAAGHTTTGSRPGAAAGRPGAAGARPGGAAGGRPATASRGNVGSHTPPGRTVSLKGGGTASVRPNGSIRSINRNGMQINH